MPAVGVRAVLGKMPMISEVLPKRVLALGKTGVNHGFCLSKGCKFTCFACRMLKNKGLVCDLLKNH